MGKLLIGGEEVLFDDEDFGAIAPHSWSLLKTSAGGVYCKAHIRGRSTLMHRHILGLSDGAEADHRNGNGLDNRRRNLRVCTRLQNMQNRRRFSNNASGYKGVYFDKRNVKNKWRARITVKGDCIRLGNFATPVEAARAYDKAALFHFGEYASLNRPRRPRILRPAI